MPPVMELPLKEPEDCTILLVDDEESILYLFKNELVDEGFNVIVSNNGDDALTYIREHKLDLVISDVYFQREPQINGYDICRLVKTEYSADFIPVILMTGIKTERLNGLAVGADDFLIKPVHPNELRVLARSLIRTKQLYEMVVLSRQELEERVEERTQELREASDRLVELSQVKTNVIQVISHELRTPLHRGRTALSLAKDRLEGHTDSFDDVFSTVEDAFLLLENRIEDIELFSDPAGIEPTACAVKDIIYGAVNQARILADGRSNDIDLRMPDVLPAVLAHSRSVMKALAHLIHNGVKFSEHKQVAIRASSDDSGVLIEVIDQGPGIPQEIIDHLREPIKSMDLSTTRFYGGMGIGLAIVSLIFDVHDITLEFDTSGKVGTAVRFTLPLAKW